MGNTSEASSEKQQEKIDSGETEKLLLLPSISKRLQEGPSPSPDDAIRDEWSRELVAISGDESIPIFDRRKKVLDVISRLTEGLDANGVHERYGSIVLGNLEALQNTSLSPANLGAREKTFQEIRGDLPGDLSRILAKAYEGDGLQMPKSEDEVKRHPYLYIDPAMKIVRVRGDLIERDKKTLGGLCPASAATFIKEHVQLLDDMKAADPLGRLVSTPDKYKLSPLHESAKKSLKTIVGLVALVIAAISAYIERDRDVPLVALAYAGIAVLMLKPDMFSGKLRTMRGQLDFVQSDFWDNLMTYEKLTGTSGRQFFEEMTKSDVRRLFAQTKNKKNPLSMEEFYGKLTESGVSQESIAALRSLPQEKRDALLTKLQAVLSQDAKNLLAEFAEKKMDAGSFAKIPVLQERPEETSDYAARAELIGNQFRELGPLNYA